MLKRVSVGKPALLSSQTTPAHKRGRFSVCVPGWRVGLVKVVALLLALGASGLSAEEPTRQLFDPAAAGADKLLALKPAEATATIGPSGITVTIPGGPENYPGVAIKPAGAETWDLSALTATTIGTRGPTSRKTTPSSKTGSSSSASR